MKSLAPSVCLWLCLAGAVCGAPQTAPNATPEPDVSPGLWLTVRFGNEMFAQPYRHPEAPVPAPDAEASTLVAPGARFQLRLALPPRRPQTPSQERPQEVYEVAGVVDAPAGGQYPLWFRVKAGPWYKGGAFLWEESRVRLVLDRPFICAARRGYSCSITLSRAPEWRPPTKPLRLTPDAPGAGSDGTPGPASSVRPE